MSDSEDDDVFEIEDDDSDAFVANTPPAKKQKVAAAAKSKSVAAAASAKASNKPKAAPKKAAGSKAKAAVSSAGQDTDTDDGDGDSPVSKPFQPSLENNGQAGKGKSASEMYQKLSQIEHILKRPDSYIGSVQSLTQDMWVFNSNTKKMVYKTVTFVPGFFKIFDEILVNAADNKINDSSMDTFKVAIDREKKSISVMNNGKGIPIEMHSKEKMWIPEMIFGHLLTSSNYDDDEKKLTGGRNGYGAKLTNIYSLEFTVETADKNTGQKFVQTFSENMSKRSKPKITANPKNEEYTKITYKPDLARFGMTEIDDDTFSLLTKRVYDMAGTVRGVRVFLDGTKLKVDGFKKYVEMYLFAAADAATEAGAGAGAVSKSSVVFEQVNERWEIAFALAPEQEFTQVSFVNSISTIKGGTHVESIASALAEKLLVPILKKNKAATVKVSQIKNHMWVFVNALIENPAFDSQTKETLNTKRSHFGSKCPISEDFVKKVIKTGIVDEVLSWAKFKQEKDMKKTDGGKKARISGILKLEDANLAGTKNGKDCTLILTEGDSAKSMVVSGFDIVGRDRFGVFPLRGKLLNVREATGEQLMKNQEIKNLKQIMGLKEGVTYTSVDKLRYGSLMIMTDQDHDGSHIKGLLINFLDHFYPSLLKIPGFLVEFITPIIRAVKGKVVKDFYTLPEFGEWREANNDARGWYIKYLKGLGTSDAEDGKKYFSDLGKHMLTFDTIKEGDRDLIDLAFNKKKADDRKEWLRLFKPGTFLDQSIKTIPYSDFINKELILFSMADNIRSIPSVVDGLKPGQRKVLYGCYLKKLKTEIKVVQLAGFISEKAAYHHGDVSLQTTIIGLAQNYIGSNNINLLVPSGQYGSRAEGGKDHAAPRYIFTNLTPINRTIFHPHDDAVLNYLTDDNDTVEPEWYVPVIPMVLVNGADGIGTGWSTQIPNYNPAEIVDNIRRIMRGEPQKRIDPWFRGYNGTITRNADDKYTVSGRLEKTDDETVVVTELPIRKWTIDYKAMLEAWIAGTDKTEPLIKSYDELHTAQSVKFVVKMSSKQMKSAEDEGLDKRFKIHSTLSVTNMVCFDPQGRIKRYATPEQIIEEFYGVRLEYYIKRKEKLINEINDQYEKLSNQARFVQMCIDGELVISNRKTAAIVDELRKLKFRPFPIKGAAREAGEDEDVLDEEDDGLASDYNYLLGMAIRSLTAEKVQKLLNAQEEKRSELDELLRKTPMDLWNVDLDSFLAEWELILKKDAEIAAGSTFQRSKTKGKALATKALAKIKKGKALDDDDDDSGDDFVAPSKKVAAVKRKAPATKPKIEPKVEEMDLEDGLIKKEKSVKIPPATKPKSKSAVLSDDEIDKKPIRAPTKPKAKISAVLTDDEEEEEPKPAKAVPKSKTKSSIVLSGDENVEDDDDDYSVMMAKSKAKPVSSTSSTSKKSPRATSKPAVKKPTAAASKKAGAVKKKAESDEEDFDLSMDMDIPPPAASRSKRAAAATKPRYVPAYVDLSDDE
ncbi:dna topoisomerase ii [Phaffia rhodozyma]|uniref:DNA topoisomerase 2 n=1 Tax=Phaffia rhodozyma TaxID=264483 RepID=A0A0F7SSL3_PHARH|nr:dna topoisomerase ii [Phaffia rhodozyma]